MPEFLRPPEPTEQVVIAMATLDAAHDVREVLAEWGLLALFATLEPGVFTWEASARECGQAILARVPEPLRELYYTTYGKAAESAIRALRG